MIKNLNKLGIERTYLNNIEAMYNKLTADTVCNSESLKAFLCQEKDKVPTITTLIQYSLGSRLLR